MEFSVPPEDFRGTVPDILGSVCEALMYPEFWYQGNLNDPMSAVYLRFKGLWTRFYFDHGFIFWQPVDETTEHFDATRNSDVMKWIDLGGRLGIVGSVLSGLRIHPADDRNIISLSFENGVIVEFSGTFKDTAGWRVVKDPDDGSLPSESPARYDILAGLPSTGPQPEQFSPTGRGMYREGFVVRFLPVESAPWVGNFQVGFGKCNGVFFLPDSGHLVVVASGQAYVVDPETRALLYHFGSDIDAVVEVPEIGVLVFTNGCWFEAFGASGLLWRSRRVSWDGFRNLIRHDLTLRGEAYSPLDEAYHPFTLYLVTGDVDGGSYDGPPM